MDIALCAFCLPERKVVFAGANRPLWRIRKDQLEVVSSDKLPIGGLQLERQRKFTNHTLDLEPGDSVYLFSDGYADQFGGEAGKKLMTKKLKEILLSIREKPMSQQGQYLEDFVTSWRGRHEQVDDILVIGIRM